MEEYDDIHSVDDSEHANRNLNSDFEDDHESDHDDNINDGDFEDGRENENDFENDHDDDFENDSANAEDLSGIELYLAKFDIEGGMINLADGTSKHFSELDSAAQAKVLDDIHKMQDSDIESKYGLDDTEISVINYLRENNITIEQLIEKEVASRLGTTSSEAVDFKSMSPEDIYTSFLLNDNPELTEEQISAAVSKAKELPNFNSIANNIRSQFVAAQEQEHAQKEYARQVSINAELDADRTLIVNTAANINEIGGYTLNDHTKNAILDRVLDVNEEGDSLFMDEVFSNPEKLFKAAFWYYNGEALLQQKDEYWKKEKSAAYKRGMGGPSSNKRVTFSSKKESIDDVGNTDSLY